MHEDQSETTLDILYLENDPARVNLVQALLQADGFRVSMRQVDSVRDWLPALQHPASLVLINARLPEDSGEQALALAREHCPAAPCIMISSVLDEEAVVASLLQGAQDYVCTERIERLVPVVRRALHKRRGQTQESPELALTEKALRQSIREMRQIIDTMVDTFYRTDAQGMLVMMSPSVQNLLGYGVEELLGTPVANLYADADGRDRFLAELQRNHGTVYGYEAALRHKDGRIVWVQTNSHFLFDTEGKLTGVEGITRDITEKKQKEKNLLSQLQQNSEQLRQTETRISSILDTVADAIISIDARGRVDSFNRAAEKIFGYAASEVIGQNVSILMPEPHAAQHDQYLQRYFRHETESLIGVARELIGRRRDGSTFPIELSTTEMVIDGETMFTGVIRDITERKRAEQQLRKTHERLTHLLLNMPTVLYSMQVNGTRLAADWISDNIERITGYSPQDVFAPDWWISHVHPDDRQYVEMNMQTLFEKGELTHEYRFLMKNGHYAWILDRLEVIRDEHGKPVRVTGSWNDVSDRRHMEDALRQSEERLRRSQVFANIGTWDWDIKTNDLYWSERIPPLFGHPEGHLDTTFENFLNAIHPDDRQAVTKAVNDCIDNGKAYEIEHRVSWPDGTVRWLQERGDVVRDRNGEPLHMLGVVQDITRRRELEEKLEHQRTLLNLLRHAMNQFVVSADFHDICTPLLQGLLVITQSEFGFIGEILHTQEGRPYLKSHAISNIAWNEESRALHDQYQKSGMEFHNLETLFGHTIKSGEIVLTNDPAHHPKAGGLPKGHPQLDSYLGVPVYYGGQMVGMYGIANRPGGYSEAIIDFLQPFNVTYGVMIHGRRLMDLQEQTLVELESARVEEKKASQAKSEFLSSMSHELRTPMNAILGFTQLLELDENFTEDQRENIREIHKAGQHLLDLINEILDLAKIEAGQIGLDIQPVRINDLMTECIALIRPMCQRQSIALTYAGSGECAEFRVFADRVRLKQVLLNLMSNAVKYNKPDGRVEIQCALLDADTVRIEVSDTGIGMTDLQMRNLYTSFNRLGAERTDIEGTGIGLVIAKRLVDLMQGTLEVESVIDVGTTFTLDLHLCLESESTGELDMNMETSARDRKSVGRNQVVLYIEDNPANLRLVDKLLSKRSNVHLLTAQDPHTGIELAESRHPDLILLDINLPDMDGYEVEARLRRNPELRYTPIVGISANAMTSDVEKGLGTFDDYLTKPLDLGRFYETVDRFLKTPRK